MQCAVVGVPGTGKTYFMVSYLKKYFSYDPFFREYTIKSDVLIITNIAGLKFYGSSCWNIESPEILGNPKEGVKGKYTREEFFTVKNFENIMHKTGKQNIILCLDEVQQDHYFPLAYKHADVLFLFAYHRHIGMDIILGTQDACLISRGVLAQCEYLAHGKLRSKKIIGSMSYNFTDNKGGHMYSKTLPVDKEVFAAYQSASVEEVNKPKNAILHWFIITIVFFVSAFGLFKFALATVNEKSKPKTPVKPVAPVVSPPSNLSSVSPGANVQKPYSTGKLVPVAQLPQVPEWRSYQVEAFIQDGPRRYFIINGNYVDDKKCRNYQPRFNTVDYYSLEPLAVRRSAGAAPSSAHSPQRIAEEVKPLGETSDKYDRPFPNLKTSPDYTGIPSATDLKTSQVKSLMR